MNAMARKIWAYRFKLFWISFIAPFVILLAGCDVLQEEFGIDVQQEIERGLRYMIPTPEPETRNIFGNLADNFTDFTDNFRNNFFSRNNGEVVDNPNWHLRWTEADQFHYEQLRNSLQTREATAFRIEMTSAIQSYRESFENNDIFFMNEAVYKASRLRQSVYDYVDTYDYMHGHSELVFLGAHGVPPLPRGIVDMTNIYHHLSIVIMVDSSSTTFWNDVRFTYNFALYGGRVRYATIGASGETFTGGYLISGINRRPNDIDLSIKTEMISLCVFDSEIIFKLFLLELNYRSTAPYTLFPAEFDEHNSNSFVHGLLLAAGISPPKPNRNLPGWYQPLEGRHFERCVK